MKRGTSILAGAMALILASGAPAVAQERASDNEVADAATMLLDKLAILAEGLGMEAPLLSREMLASAFAGALPMLPADDPGLSWSTGFAFDFTTNVTTGALEPDEEGRTVLTDGRGCLEADDIAEVVHFQRFTRGEVRGHRCIIAFGGADGENSWVIQSRTFAEGPDRRLTAYYGVATSISRDSARARQVLEERLEQNVALAGFMADYALEILLAKDAASTPLTTDSAAERMARLQERLADIAASFDTPSPAPEPGASTGPVED